MSNVYELLQRHPMLLTANTTIIGSEAHLPAGWAEHAAEHKVQVITADWLTAQAYQADKETPLVQFGVPDVAGLAGRLVIVLWPKAKAAGQALVSMLSQQVDNCYVVAANDAGGKSIGNALKDFASESTKMDSARHCSLWNIRLNKSEGTANWLRFASSFPPTLKGGNSWACAVAVHRGSLRQAFQYVLYRLTSVGFSLHRGIHLPKRPELPWSLF